MFVNETEFVRVIKSAWRSCTLKVQKLEQDGDSILVLESKDWKWQCVKEEVNRKILATIIELCGFIPEQGERWMVGKDMDAQLEIEQGITWVDLLGIESRMMPIVMGTVEGYVRFVQAYDKSRNDFAVKSVLNFYADMMKGKTLKTEQRQIYCISTEDYIAFSTGDEQLSIYYYELDCEREEYKMYERLKGLKV